MATTRRKALTEVLHGQLDADVQILQAQRELDDAVPYVVGGTDEATPIDAKTAGETTLVTVPAGKALVVTEVVLYAAVISSPSGNPSISLGGNASTYNDYSADGARVLNALGKYNRTLGPTGDQTAYAAAATFKLKINTPATGTTYKIHADVIGYLIDV